MKKKTCSQWTLSNNSTMSRIITKADYYVAKAIDTLALYKWQLLVIFAVYCLAMLAVWRSGFSYMDDLGRAVDGYDWSFEFNRYSSSALAHILSVNMSLIDVSPWFQIIAVAILSISSLLVAYIVSGWKKPKWPAVIASMFVGLTPFMAGSLLYKFDSVCMAASMLFALLPVAVWGKLEPKNRRCDILYFVFAAICVLLVLTSYQASCGIVIVAVVAAVVAESVYNPNVKWSGVKVLMQKLGVLVVSGILACSIFYFLLPSPGGYRDTNLVSVTNIIPHTISVVREIYGVCIQSMNGEWTVLLLIAILTSLLSVVLCSRKRGVLKLVDGIIPIIFLAISIPLSYGIYIMLEQATPLSDYDWGRYLIGCGTALAFFFAMCFAVIADRTNHVSLNIMAIVPVAYVLYSFFIFCLAIGNGLSDQGRFAESRMSSFMATANSIGINADTDVQFYGTIGLSPVMEHVREQYPVTKYIIGIGQHGLSEGYWGELRLKRYNKFNFISAPAECSSDAQVIENEFFKVYYSEKDNAACAKIL